MAVEFEGFSIREYVSKMRTVDVVKCWPFGGDDSEEEVKPKEEGAVVGLLPPITVPKFRWWSHELELLRSKDGDVVCGNSKISELQEEESEIVRNVSNLVSEKADAEKPEVSSASEDEKLDLVCPVCRVFTAATVNAVNAHLDSCLARAREERRRMIRAAAAAMKAKAKAKAKAPKKRSIVEIFAVAPQIEAVNLEDDEDEESVGEGEVDRAKVSSGSQVASSNKKSVKKNGKLKKEKFKKFKKKSKKNVSIAKKEKSHKVKLQTPINFPRMLNGSPSNKRFSKDVIDAVSICKKKPSLIYLSTQKKHKVVRNSRLIAKRQKPVLPVRGILKNHIKVISGKNSSIMCNIQDGSEANPCGIQQSERHVRFSDKDDILGPRKKHVPSIECPKLRSIFNSSSDAIAASSAKDQYMKSDRGLAYVEVNGSDEDDSISTEHGTEVQPVIEKKRFSDIHDHADIPNFLRPHVSCREKGDHLSATSLSLSDVALNGGNSHMFDQGNPTVSHSTSNAGIPRLLFALKEGYTPIMNSQMGGNASRASNTSEKLIDHIGYPTPGVAAMSSMVNMKALPQPSSSCLSISEIANGMRIPFLSQSITENYNGRALQYCPLSPKELMGSLCSLPGWNQKAVMSGEKCMDENFFGLPLNSQGELIQLNSSCKGGFHQLKKPSTVTGSSSSLPMYNHGLPKSTGDYLSLKERHCVERTLPKDQFKLLPVQNYVKENPNVHVASRLGITESCGTGRTDIHWLDSERGNNHFVHLLEPDLNLMNISCHGCRQHDQVQMQTGTGQLRLQENSDQILLHTTQPTMRLMGKDVTVGRSSKDSLGIEDGKVWTDKEIITEHCPTSTVLDNMSAKRHFLQDWGLHSAPEKSKETGAHSFDILSNQVSQSLLQVKAPESRFSYPYSNWQPNIASQNGSLIINGNSSSKLHSFAHPTRSPALFNRAPNFQEPFICETGPLKVSSQMPIPLSTPHNTCQHMDLNSAEFKYKRSLPQATKSAFEFPFLHPDCKEQVQPSWLQATSKSLPPWLLHATQQKRTSITSSQPYSDVGGKYHPCNMSGTNFLSISPVHHSPVASYPCNPMTSHSHMQNSLGPASLPHPPLIPVYPGYKSTSVINMGYRNRSKVKDRPKSKSFPVKGPNHGSKSRKRPAAKVDHSTKPTKIPNLQIQEDFSVMTGLKARGNSSNEMQCNAGALELDSIRDNARGVGCGPKETQKDGLRTSFVIDSSKVDGMTRSGPIKLSAGVKHILKPSQNMDQDNSRPTHSTVPFVAVTKSCRVPESQEKSAKIYRF